MNSLAGLSVRRLGESQKAYAARLKAEQADRSTGAAQKEDKVQAEAKAVLRIVRRTFEAKQHPKGSAERARLNLSAITSEYLPSYRYLVLSGDAASYGEACTAKQFRTKREAEQYLEQV